MKKNIFKVFGLTVIMSLALPLLSYAATFSDYWYQDANGTWHIKDGNGNMVTNAWLCDDAVPSNGQNIWYLIDANGNMVSAGLVQDQTGSIYSLETSHQGFFGMLRYQSGAYDGVYLDLEGSHEGAFSKIKNHDGIAGLQAIYGLTQVNIDNSNIVYTSNFANRSSGGTQQEFDHYTVDGKDVYVPKQETVDPSDNRTAAERYRDMLGLTDEEYQNMLDQSDHYDYGDKMGF